MRAQAEVGGVPGTTVYEWPTPGLSTDRARLAVSAVGDIVYGVDYQGI